jgi:Spy/CpxP family protein refolding chaperone
MKNNTIRFLLLLSLLLNLSVLATTGFVYFKHQDYWTSPFGFKIKKGHFLFEELSLNPEQSQAMKEKSMAFRAEIDRRRQEVTHGRKTLLALMRQERTDKTAVDAAVAEISRMQEEIQRMIIRHMLDMKAMLAKDQQAKFIDLIEKALDNGRPTDCPPAELSQ